MPLHDVPLNVRPATLPGDVARFLREAERRMDRFSRQLPSCTSSFVPSDYVTVYWAIRAIVESNLMTGHSFCEWGSGLGVVASLAAMLEFDACGIEIDRSLVELSEELATDFELSVELVHGSFIPPGGESIAEEIYQSDGSEISWLETSTDDAYEQLGLDPDDFALFFAYPWPGEERVVAQLFEHFAAEGAMLLTYDQFDTVVLRRKVTHP